MNDTPRPTTSTAECGGTRAPSPPPAENADAEAYLWNPARPPNEEIASLEQRLNALRFEPRPDELRRAIDDDAARDRDSNAASPAPRLRFPTRYVARALAAAALIALALTIGFLQRQRHAPEWDAVALGGTPTIRDDAFTSAGRLRVGEWLETNAAARARLDVPRLGFVEVDPGSRLRLVNASETEQRLELARGRIHATINAPPRLFLVDTPAGLAADLGCVYTLEVEDPTGASLLTVDLGWVEVSNQGAVSLVPADAACRAWPRHAPGTPVFKDAPAELVAAVTAFDEAAHAKDAAAANAALDTILALARPRDSLTLWHLLPRAADANARRGLYERLLALAPPPEAPWTKIITRDAILRLDPEALEAWWDELPRYW